MESNTTNPVQPSEGIIYITYGIKYVRAALFSANSARRVMPDIKIHLFVDQPSMLELGLDKDTGPFTSMSVIENPHRRSKVDCISQTPFDRTLYLDSDTSVERDIRTIFRLLDNFEFAATHAVRRNASRKSEYWNVQIPDAFPQFNGGVIVYKKNPNVMKLMRDWGESFGSAGHRHDQITLRELVWLSDVRSIALAPEYNVRFLKYKYLWDKGEATAMILHLKQYHDGWGGWYWTRVKNGFVGAMSILPYPLRWLTGFEWYMRRRKNTISAKKAKKTKG